MGVRGVCITKEEDKQINEMLLDPANESYRDIASAVNVSPRTVELRARRLNIPKKRRGPVLSKELLSQLTEAFLRGKKQSVIARDLKIDVQTVRKYTNRLFTPEMIEDISAYQKGRGR